MKGARRMQLSRDAAVGAILVVLAVATVGTSLLGTWQLKQSTDCQRQFNTAYRAALDVRSDANARVRQAQRTFMLAITDRPVDPRQAAAQRQDAIGTYLVALDDADKRANENPIPDVNRCNG